MTEGFDMKGLPWIIAGIGIGAVVTFVLFNQSEPAYETSYDGFTTQRARPLRGAQ